MRFFVVCGREAFDGFIDDPAQGGVTTPLNIYNWLLQTRPGGEYADAARHVILARGSARPMATVE